MFSYYGSKSKIIHLYPSPKYDLIVEPFAGSARYALKYFERDVILVDKYSVVIDIWKWLQQCSRNDILSLPKLQKGDDLRTFNLSREEKLFLGMLAGIASTSPRHKISSYSAEQNGRKNKMKHIANQLYKIKHWQFIHGTYECLANPAATWFIDPPYFNGGQAYICNNIDFEQLAQWSNERNGQTIVCENANADWMPFQPLCVKRSGVKFQAEMFWTNEKVYHQQEMF